MDIHQLASMIEWLDEERRRDKTTIATLQERLQQQEETMTTLQRRLSGLESEQTVIKGATLPAQKELDLVETMRKEMRQLQEQGESRRLVAEREAEKRHELNRETLVRTVREITEQVERLQRSTGSITEVKSEGSRIADMVAALYQRVEDLAKKMEEPDRRLAFLEEQRRQDARRISETETEIPEVRKQLDNMRPKLTLIEDLSIRNERRIQEIQNSERERREQIQQFIDSQTLVMQQRDTQIETLLKRFGDHDSEMQQNIQRFEAWAQAYRDMKRIIDDFERIGDRLERRISEVAEMQRLSEERFRQEWNDWRDDDQKRWKQLTLSNDEVWRNHDKEFEQYIARLNDLLALLPPLQDSVRRMWALERERAQLYRERYQALLLEYDTTGNPVTGGNGSNGSY
jgi:DNA repair exonuclease SbcCD ATPase subunit